MLVIVVRVVQVPCVCGYTQEQSLIHMKQIHFTFVAYHQKTAGNSKPHKICLENFVCVRQKHPVFHMEASMLSFTKAPSLSTQGTPLEIDIYYLWRVFQASLLNTSSPVQQNQCKPFAELCDDRFLRPCFLSFSMMVFQMNK